MPVVPNTSLSRVEIPTNEQLTQLTKKQLGYLTRCHYDSETRTLAASELGKRSGGRPVGSGLVLKPCPKCGKPFGARAIRAHVPKCGNPSKLFPESFYKKEGK
jgi:hypothetical protein